jgi:hypothetical protein
VTHSDHVTTQLELRLVVVDGPTLPVTATLRYEAGDPWAIRVHFRTGDDGEGVEWLFARQLLTDGVNRPAGQGDVRVWPAPDRRDPTVFLAMSSPSGSALFEVDRDRLARFLQRTYRLVAAGAEDQVVDLDVELSLLLRDVA